MLRFLRWCESSGVHPAAITRGELRDYRHGLVEAGLCRRSVDSLLWAACVYLEQATGQRMRVGMRRARREDDTRLPRHLMKEQDWERVLSYLERFDDEPSLRRRQDRYRAHVLVELLYASGIRIAEAAAITEADIDRERKQVTIREGKGGRDRIAFLSDFAADALSGFLRLRPYVIHQGFGHPDCVFGMSAQNLSHMASRELARACASLELAPVTAHGVRHMVGWHLLRSGACVRSIQGILGHLQLKSTEIYTRVDKESLKAVLDDFHPRSGKTDAVENRLLAV